jgi:hypothetical protein
MVTDPATGIVLGLPERLLTQSRDTAWHALGIAVRRDPIRDVQVQRARPDGEQAVRAYEARGAKPQIEWSKLSDDGFVFGGMQGLKYFYVHAKAQNGQVGGYTLLFDQALEGILEPIVPAITKPFTPVPQNAAPSAPPPKIVKFGSGIVISHHGHILTSAAVTEGCDALLANGLDPAERIAVGDGLALLHAPAVEKLTPMAIASADGAGVLTLVGVPHPREQKGGEATRYIPARLAGDALELVRPKPLAGLRARLRSTRKAGSPACSTSAIRISPAPRRCG